LFPTSASAWCSIAAEKLGRPGAASNTCGFWSWRPRTARSKWTKVLRVLLAGRRGRNSGPGDRGHAGVERGAAVRDVQVAAVDLGLFDHLYGARECCNEHSPADQNGIAENLRELHLPAMPRLFRTNRTTSREETLSYEQYLLELAERECEARRRNRIAKLQRESVYRERRRWPTFDLKRLPTKVRTTTEGAVRRKLSGPQGELATVRESGSGQRATLLCALARN